MMGGGFDKIFIAVFTIELIFSLILFVWAANRLSASDRDREDAAKWRHSQPIGVVKKFDVTPEGLVVEGQMFSGSIPGFKPTPASVVPKPDWELKTTHFTMHREEMLDVKADMWGVFIRKLQQIWIEMLKNDGYHVADTIDSYVEEAGGLIYGYQKVVFEVKVYKESRKES